MQQGTTAPPPTTTDVHSPAATSTGQTPTQQEATNHDAPSPTATSTGQTQQTAATPMIIDVDADVAADTDTMQQGDAAAPTPQQANQFNSNSRKRKHDKKEKAGPKGKTNIDCNKHQELVFQIVYNMPIQFSNYTIHVSGNAKQKKLKDFFFGAKEERRQQIINGTN